MKSFLSIAPLILAAAASDWGYGDDVVVVTSTVQVVKTVQMDQCCAFSGTTFYGVMPSASAAGNSTTLAIATASETPVSVSPVSSVSPVAIISSVSSSVAASSPSDPPSDDDDPCANPAPVGADCTSSDICCAKGLACDGVTNTCLIISDPDMDDGNGGVCDVGPGVPGADCSQYTDCCGDNISCNRESGKCECDDLTDSCGNGEPGGQPKFPTTPARRSFF